jgi:hypothetical protein
VTPSGAGVKSAAARRAVDEQAALRRVATLAARAVPATEIFDAVTTETKSVLEMGASALMRLEDDGTVTVVAAASSLPLASPVGQRIRPEAGTAVERVLATGAPARIEGYEPAESEIAGRLHDLGYRGAVGAPVVVHGRIWVVMIANWTEARAMPSDLEDHLVQFTEIVATAIANAESREALAQLAAEQAALRRVATLVAARPSAEKLFGVVAREVAELFGVPAISMVRFEKDGSSVQIGPWGDENPFPLGTRFDPGQGVMGLIWNSKRPARVDAYGDLSGPVVEALARAGVRSSIGAPIVVWKRGHGERSPPSRPRLSLSPRARRTGWGASPSSSRRPSRTTKPRSGSRSSPKSRRPCGGLQRLWRKGRRRTKSSGR